MIIPAAASVPMLSPPGKAGYNHPMNVSIEAIDLMPAVLPRPSEAPIEQREGVDETGGPYVVILYNCDCHTFQEVESQLQKATGCTLEKAKALAKEIDGKGRAIVFAGSDEKCEQVAGILRQIRLQVETDRA
jgi:ATP-dependent Clp protease adaptor protein ClpS